MGGAFLQNCPEVKYGFFGSLEVFSKTAFSILLANLETCKHDTVSDWKIGVEKGKYGPMGEDLFAQICMQKNLWWHADCASTHTAAIHPVRHPDEYTKCIAD